MRWQCTAHTLADNFIILIWNSRLHFKQCVQKLDTWQLHLPGNMCVVNWVSWLATVHLGSTYMLSGSLKVPWLGNVKWKKNPPTIYFFSADLWLGTNRDLWLCTVKSEDVRTPSAKIILAPALMSWLSEGPQQDGGHSSGA